MSIKDAYASDRFGLSFELFPPKTPESAAMMWQTVADLMAFEPALVTCTYGAGGSTRGTTLDVLRGVRSRHDLPVASHLTCVGSTVDELRGYLREAATLGVAAIVALRGDPPELGQPFVPHPDGYASAADLVAGLRDIAPFEISVAAYPEKHPEAASAASDLDNLKRKLDAGATRAISQFFFSPEVFFRFCDAAAAAGIDAEIVPGILPVSNVAQARKFAAACGATIPDWMDRLFEGLDDHPGARQLIAATVAAEMCRKLYAGGVRHFHFYTLNRAELSYAICHLLGLRPQGA